MVKIIRISLSWFFLFLSIVSFAQKKGAVVSGKVIGENEETLKGVSVTILGQQKGIITTDSGTFSIKVPSDKAFALIFSHSGYNSVQQNFILNENEIEKITVRLEPGTTTMEEVIIRDQRERNEVGLIRPNPKT